MNRTNECNSLKPRCQAVGSFLFISLLFVGLYANFVGSLDHTSRADSKSLRETLMQIVHNA